ncbi:MAG TPA: MAPEG family protein, partial [Ramlibacter sp.]
FELPVLFYAAVLLSLVLMIQDAQLVRLAWGFVLLRIVHSVIHCTYNNVSHRFVAYALSSLFLLFMWIRLGAYILTH